MIWKLLLPVFLSLPSYAVAQVADSFQPTSGARILGNKTYTMTWSFLVPYTSCYGIEFQLPYMTPPSYTTTLDVQSRKHNEGKEWINTDFSKPFTQQ
jgi:hypothetical protein